MKPLSMERRALIAFAVSMILFLGYDALYLGPKMKVQRARREAALLAQAREDSARARADTTASRRSAPALAGPARGDTLGEQAASRFSTADSTAGAMITIATPLYEIGLSALGAEVESIRLLHYRTDGQPVDMLPPGQSWSGERMLEVRLRGEHEALSLRDIAFEASAGAGVLADGARVEVAGDQPTEVVFRAAGPSGMIERWYRFRSDRYDFETGLRVSEGALPGAINVRWSLGPGLQATEHNRTDDQRRFKASVLLGEEFHRRRADSFGQRHIENYSGTLNFASLQTKYFLVALYPPEPSRADIEMSGIKATHNVTQAVTLPVSTGGGENKSSVRIYAGPLDYKLLEGLGVGLEKNVELGWQWIRPVSKAVLWAMTTLYKVIPNYGWVIVIISVMAKVLFYRLTHKSFTSMKEMQALQPRLQALKEKYGSDRRRLSEETMKLYKEAGVNPLGGCLPMLLQMPVFVALYSVLSCDIALRGAPFLGWINDLSRQDVLFKLPVRLPLIHDNFSLLPLLMGGAMFAQSKLGGSPTGSTSPMPPGYTTILPIVFTVLFYNMPSGLVIYWIINTVISVVQQYYIVKDTRGPKLAVVEEAPKKRGRAKKA